MQNSCNSDFISCQDMSVLEDSRYAFFSSYEVLRDRYNKLKNEYRKLVSRKTCCRCSCPIVQQSANHTNGLQREFIDQTKIPAATADVGVGDLSWSPDSAELIRDVTFLQEKLARLLKSSSSDSDFSSVSNAVASLQELKHQISLPVFSDGITEESQPTASLKQDENLEVPLKLQSAPLFKGWDIEDCNLIEEQMCSLISMVSEQNAELTMVCEKLMQQNAVLTHLSLIRFSESKSGIGVKDDVLDIEGWSIVSSR